MNVQLHRIIPKIKRTPMGLWLVRDEAGQIAYCGIDPHHAQTLRHRLVQPSAELPAPAVRPPLLPYGDPGPCGAGRGELEAATITHERWFGRGQVERSRVTVARRSSAVLRCLSEAQRAALTQYACDCERVGAMRGAMGESSGRRRVDASDVALLKALDYSRVKDLRDHLAKRTVELSTRGQADRPPGRPITELDLLDAVAIDAVSLSALLARHRWPKTRYAVKALGAALKELLDRM